MSYSFIHFSRQPFLLPKKTPETPGSWAHLGTGIKPAGCVWACRRSAWLRWCLYEKFNPDNLCVANIITVDTTRLLMLVTVEDFMAFLGKYARGTQSIRWPELAAEYSGVLFSARVVSQLQFLEDHMLPYCLDVGCVAIWDTSTITSVTSVATRIDPKKKSLFEKVETEVARVSALIRAELAARQ